MRTSGHSSSGEAPDGSLGRGLIDARDLTTMVCTKIDKDLGDLQNRRTSEEAKKLCRDLHIAGSWMFAGAPESVAKFFQRVVTGKEPVGRQMQA